MQIITTLLILFLGLFASAQLNSLTEQQVREVIDNVLSLHKNEIDLLSFPIVVSYSHDSDTNSNVGNSAGSAYRWNSDFTKKEIIYTLSIAAGTARNSKITEDGVALIFCHELGHIIGGAPYFEKNDYPSQRFFFAEGQADFFAASKCMKRYAETYPQKFDQVVDPVLREKCKSASSSHNCERIGMAGFFLLKTLSGFFISTHFAKSFSFSMPSDWNQSRIGYTHVGHPDNQCRLDTIVAGALCDESRAACERPACWYVTK